MEGQAPDQMMQGGQHAFRAADGSQPDLPKSTKRQRVSQACGPCRDRKTRCDGRQPICRACETRGVTKSCNFDYVRRQRQPRASGASVGHSPQSDSLRHIRELGSDPRNHAAAQALSDLGQQPREVAAPASMSSTSTVRPSDSAPSAPSVAGQYQPTWSTTSRADGLATLADGSDGSIYGPSSAVAFLRHVMPHKSGTATPVEPSLLDPDVKPRPSVPLPDRHLPRSHGLAVLPRRREADNFLLCYWEFIHPLFPVLHRPAFLRKYESLWIDTDDNNNKVNESEVEDAIFTSTLNLVFAIGCKFSSIIEAAQKSTVAEDFFQRSRQSYAFDILDSTSMAVVQMLVLTGVYLQSTQHASRCWNSIGLAIRMAQSIGLHVNHSGRQQMSQVEQQMRRRIWHTCIHLDRLLSMTFGRPAMIEKQIDVPAPALIDDEYLADRGVGSQATGVLSRLGMFIYSSPLMELLEEILERFYRHSSLSQNRSSFPETTDIVTPVLVINRKLDDFAETVPDYLRVSNNSSTPGRNEDHILLQQQVLHNRFLFIRMLSLRPVLLAATKRGSRPLTKYSLDDDVIRSCCTRCVLTASRLVDGIHDTFYTLYRSSGWHSVYFTFSAAMTLLASWKIDHLFSGPEGDTRETTWSRCLVILEYYENQIHSAEHAIKILKSLKLQITSRAQASTVTQESPTQLDPTLRPTPNTDGATSTTADLYSTLSMDESDLFGTDNISEAWYGQQLINLDWLEIPQLPDFEFFKDSTAASWSSTTKSGCPASTPTWLSHPLPVILN